jgi:IS5 family transposase
MQEGCDENPERLRQADLDARWVKKNAANHYAYGNSISIDVDHGFIYMCAVTSFNINLSQMLSRLLDPDNEYAYVWADSAFSGECFKDLLSFGGFESLTHD